MKERPILFQGDMVRAILEGRKTQTRRVVKKVPCDCGQWLPYELSVVTPEGWQGAGHSGYWSCECCGPNEHLDIHCPYGIPGDRLWVRESFYQTFEDGFCYQDGLEIQNAPPWYSYRGGSTMVVPSIYMPRWASRILLEVTDVRVQRVREISEEDARAEGVLEMSLEDRGGYYSGFADLWDSINAKRGYLWDANPWVWAVTFKVLEGLK